MGTLLDCLGKAGKLINPADADALLRAAKQHLGNGHPPDVADRLAVQSFIDQTNGHLDSIHRQAGVTRVVEAPAEPVPIGDRSGRPQGAAEEAVVAAQRKALGLDENNKPIANPLRALLDKFDNGEEIYTGRDLRNDVEALYERGEMPEKLQKAIDSYDALHKADYEEFGARSGLEGEGEDDFVATVRKLAGKETKAVSSSAPKIKEAKVDVSPILNAPTESESVRIGGALMRQYNSRENMRAIQKAMQEYKPPQGEPTNAIPEQITDAGVLRREGAQPRVNMELPPVGEGNAVAQEAARNQVREGALPEPLGRPPEATRKASIRRRQEAFATPSVIAPVASAGTGAVGGFALTDREPGETDEEYQARRVRNAALGALGGAAAGLSLNALTKADAARRRGNRYAPKMEGVTEVPTPGEGQGVRQTAEKIIENRSFPKRMREALANDPEIFYDQFSLNGMKARVKGSTEAELQALQSSADAFERLAATAELVNRYSLSGDPALEQQAAELARRFSQGMTHPAQLINLGKLIESPDAYAASVRETLSGVGRDLSPAQQTKLIGLKRDAIRADKALEAASAAAETNFTAANEKAFLDARAAAAKSGLLVDQYVQQLAPDSWGEILSKTIKGNLLTFKSIVTNPAGNLLFQPINRASRALASSIDELYTAARGKPRVLAEVNPLPAKRELKAFGEGTLTAAKELLTGPGYESYAKAEIQRGFRPIRSLIQAATGEGLAIRPDGSVAVSDRFKRLFEATPMAANAEMMFRFLNLGDKGFRRSEEMRVLISQAKLKGLKGREFEQFLLFPDDATKRLIETEGRHAIFAQDNKGVRTVNAFLDHALADALNIPKDSPLRDVMKVAATTIAPYRQFPVNFIVNSANYAVPGLGYARAAYNFKRGNRKAALINTAEATMGLMMYGGVAWLWDKGLISEPTSKDAKMRTVQYENMGPGRLNLSGLERAQNGGDPKWRSGDQTVSWETMGVPSFVFSIYSSKAAESRQEAARTGERARLKNFSGMSTLVDPRETFPGMASAALEQSFLAGTSAFLDALRDWDEFGDAWSRNTFRAVSSLAVPNNIEAFARTQYQYIPELRGDTTTDSWRNIWRFKTLQLPKDDRALVKRGIWGQPIERTPSGKNPYLDQFVDFTRSQKREIDDLGKSLNAVWEQTESPDVYPALPQRNFEYNGVVVKLTPDDYDAIQRFVGQARRQYAEQVVQHPAFALATTLPEAKIMGLQEAYAEGAKQGKAMFLSQPETKVKYPELFGLPSGKENRVVARDVKARGRLRLQEQTGQ